jgi:hypothetical protein
VVPQSKGVYPDDFCYKMSVEERDKFAPYAFVFSSGAELPLPPSQYAYELKAGVWCAASLPKRVPRPWLGGRGRGRAALRSLSEGVAPC